MASIDGATLQKMREVQGVHGPNMCLAASKFLALKVLGMIDPDRCLNDFLRSKWANKNSRLPLVNSWGWTMSLYNDDFNNKVLPAALNESTANVRNGTMGKMEVKYSYFRGKTVSADSLLQRGTPLVVGVGLDGSGQDHHIVVVKGTDGNIWAVDPWPGPPNDAVKKLQSNFTFTKVHIVELTSGTLHIPCGNPVFGYYRDADSESNFVFTVQ